MTRHEPNDKSIAFRRLMADVIAINVFFLVVNVANEMLLVGMAIDVCLRTRMLAMVTNSLAARPYGLWQDFHRRRLGGNLNVFRAYAADSIAFLTFQLPLYWINLYLAGQRDLGQIVIASSTIAVMAGFLGRPCGMFMDVVRRLFGVHDIRGQG